MGNKHATENKPYHQAMVGLRASSAAQPHADRRTRKARTRSAAKTKAVREFKD